MRGGKEGERTFLGGEDDFAHREGFGDVREDGHEVSTETFPLCFGCQLQLVASDGESARGEARLEQNSTHQYATSTSSSVDDSSQSNLHIKNPNFPSPSPRPRTTMNLESRCQSSSRTSEIDHPMVEVSYLLARENQMRSVKVREVDLHSTHV